MYDYSDYYPDPYAGGSIPDEPTATQNWWEGPPPPGYTGPWPPPLPPGASYGPILGQIIYGEPTPIEQTPGYTPPTDTTESPYYHPGYWGNLPPAPPAPTPTPSPSPSPSPSPTNTSTPPSSPVTPTDASGFSSFYPDQPAFAYPDFAPPTFDVPAFQAPAPFSYPEFALPSGQEVLNEDPGYGLRRDEGLRALQNNALARGVGKGGATLKSLMDFAGSLASQEYGGAANRKFGIWQANRGNAADNYDRNWRDLLGEYGVKYGQETDEYNRAADTYKTNLGKEATRYGFGLDVASGMSGGRQAASNFALNDRNSIFNNLLSLYQISRQGLPQYSF